MRTSTTKKIGAVLCSVALAFVMSVALVGCGGSSSSSDTSSESTSEQKSDSSESSESSESESSESGSSESSDSSSSSSDSSSASNGAQYNVESMGTWMGVSDKGETFYYAEANDGSKQAIMVVYDPSSNKYVSFVGTAEQVSDNQVTITDFQTGNTLTFAITAADQDGNVVIDMGEQGNAVLAKCDPSEVLKAIQAIGTYGDAVA